MDYRPGEESQDHRLEPAGWYRRKATGYRGPLPSSVDLGEGVVLKVTDLDAVLAELEGTLQRLGRYVENGGDGQ